MEFEIEFIGDVEYEYNCNAVVLDSFASTMTDGTLGYYDEFILYELQDKKEGNVIGYAIDNYHTGLQQGCFGVRAVYTIPDLSDWNSEKKFYEGISVEFKEGIF